MAESARWEPPGRKEVFCLESRRKAKLMMMKCTHCSACYLLQDQNNNLETSASIDKIMSLENPPT